MVEDCELLAESEDLELEGGPALNRSSQGMEQGNEDGSHAGHVTLAEPKRSTIPRLTEFLAGSPTSFVDFIWVLFDKDEQLP